METTPAGWYPDPVNPLQERLWDGTQWSENTRTALNHEQARDTTDSWAPPRPTAAPPTLGARSLQDLLGDVPSPAVQPLRKQLVSRRRWPLRVGAALAVVLAVTGGVFAVRVDQLRRQAETRDMLELIKESETIMLTWQDDATEAGKWLEVECAASEDRCAAAWGDEGFQESLASSAREAATALKALANEFTADRGLQIWGWHDDVVLARDSYLDHNTAWVRALEAKGRNPEEYFTDTVNDDDIGPTFTVACRNLRRIKDSSMYPNLSARNKKSIDKICAE